MHSQLRMFYVWIPRILAILVIAFLALFSLDVFELGLPLWSMLLGFVIHNIPSLVLLVILILAWRRPLIGAIGFSVVGLFFLFFFGSRMDGLAYLIVVTPIIIVGILFGFAWSVGGRIEKKG